MRTAWILAPAALVAGLGVAALAVEPKPDKPPARRRSALNLVPNGDFEAGDATPTGWQTVDGLTTFWVKDGDPKHGKVIKFDTDVYQSEGYEWWAKIAKGAVAKDAPKKTPTVGDKYDTIGRQRRRLVLERPHSRREGQGVLADDRREGAGHDGLAVRLPGQAEDRLRRRRGRLSGFPPGEDHAASPRT